MEDEEIMKEQVEEMKRLGLKAFAIGLGEEEAEKELRVTSYDVDIIYGVVFTFQCNQRLIMILLTNNHQVNYKGAE